MKIDTKNLLIASNVRSIINQIAKSGIQLTKVLKKDRQIIKAKLLNVQGEDQHQIDDLADKIFIKNLMKCTSVHSIISEEQEVKILTGHKGAKLTVAIDPLDGSSNLDTNTPVGSIFGIYINKGKRYSGKLLLVAGYIIYGNKTEMVISDGWKSEIHSVNKKRFHFVRNLSPANGIKYYSVNEGNTADFNLSVQSLIHKCKEQGLSGRYTGSMVADIHRNIQKGGLFIYPTTSKYPEGKLRLLYECLPMALIAKSLGEMSISNGKLTLELSTFNIHQRAEIVIGDVTLARSYLSSCHIVEANNTPKKKKKSLFEKSA